MQQKESDSWYWKSLLEFRGEFQNHLKKIIGNGRMTSIWFDWWLECGPLYRAYGACPWFAAELEEGDMVSCLIQNGQWIASHNERQREIVQMAENRDINTEVEDILLFGEDRRSLWSAKEVTKLLKEPGRMQGCKELLWYKHHVPRFSFVMWTALLNKLPTADRIRNWGLNMNKVCLLCAAQGGK